MSASDTDGKFAEREQPEVRDGENDASRLDDDLAFLPALAGAVFGGVEVGNIGQVARMTLPDRWQQRRKDVGGRGSPFMMCYHVAENPDVAIVFYYRGRRVSTTDGQNFRNLLIKPPHVLTAAELKSAREILRRTGGVGRFRMWVGKTEDLNGKRLLVVEGRFESVQEDAYILYLDAGGNGSIVQEIYFQAPKESYLRYLSVAKRAFKSIQWK